MTELCKKSAIAVILIITNILAGKANTMAEDSLSLVLELDSISVDTTFAIEEDNKEEYVYFDRKPEDSRISANIEISTQRLEKEINTALENVIYEDNNIEDDSLKIKITRYSNIKTEVRGNTLIAEVPLKINATSRIALGFGMSTDREIEGIITIKLASVVNINSDWSITSKTFITDYSWIEKPSVKIGGMSIHITPIVENVLDNQKSFIEKTIDKSIKSQLKIKDYLSAFWNELQEPIKIDVDSSTCWMRFMPHTISLNDLNGKDGIVSTTVEITSGLQADFYGSIKQENKASMPRCKVNGVGNDGFDIVMLVNLPYSSLNNVAKRYLAGMEFGEGRKKITVENVELDAAGEEIGIHLEAYGFVKGTINLTGKLYFDETKTSIKIKEITYKMKTRNLLTRTVNFLFKPAIKRKIENEVTIDIKEYLDSASDIANRSVLNNNFGNGIETKGNINEIFGKDVYVTPRGVQVNIELKGNVKIAVK